MTNEEARDICVMALRCFGIKHNSLLTTGAKDEMIKQIAENFDIRYMLEALEKQIPKKPNDDLCPMCSAVVSIDESYITYSMNYSVEYQAGFCPSCGQRIDWSEDD